MVVVVVVVMVVVVVRLSWAEPCRVEFVGGVGHSISPNGCLEAIQAEDRTNDVQGCEQHSCDVGAMKVMLEARAVVAGCRGAVSLLTVVGRSGISFQFSVSIKQQSASISKMSGPWRIQVRMRSQEMSISSLQTVLDLFSACRCRSSRYFLRVCYYCVEHCVFSSYIE